MGNDGKGDIFSNTVIYYLSLLHAQGLDQGRTDSMKKLISLACVAVLSGCANYQSKIVVGGASFTLPKDATFTWLQCSVPTSNGPCTLTISNGVFKMNPAVIDAATAHKQSALKTLQPAPVLI